MGSNWHELRDLGNERLGAAIAEAQGGRHSADRVMGVAGGWIRSGLLALRSAFGGGWANPVSRGAGGKAIGRAAHFQPAADVS